MNVVVTGGSGFIGSHVVDHLMAAAHDVTVLDVVPPHRSDVGFVEMDILDLEGLGRAFRGADVVFHLAAVADVNIAAADPERAVNLTVMGTTRVWEAARRAGVSRSILASTVWVYGASPDDVVLTEESTFQPRLVRHVYTAAKLASEMVVHGYHELYGQPFTVLRYGIPFGPRMRPTLVISQFVSAARSSRPITVHGDGSQYRNYVYVGDLAHAHVLALEPAAANGTFNLEGRDPVSLRRIIESLPELLGHPVDVDYVAARTGDYAGRPVSADHARDVLGWTPQTSFEDGLRSYVDWHVANIDDAPAVSEEAMAPALVSTATPSAPPRQPVRVGFRETVRSLAIMIAAVAVGFPVGLAEQPRASVAWASWIAVAIALAVIGWQVGARWAAGPARAVLGAGFVLLALWLQPVWVPGAIRPGLVVVAGLGLGLMGDRPTGDGSAALIGGMAAGAMWAGHGVAAEVVLLALLTIVWLVVTTPARRPERRGRLAVTAVAVLCVGAVFWVGLDSMGAAWFAPFDTRVHGAGDEVALTFDGGPNDTSTLAIAHTLDDYHTQGTFFLLGEAARARPDIARLLSEDGQLVSNNSYNEDHLAWLKGGVTGLDRTQQVLAQQLGACPAFFRPPHGQKTPWMSWRAHRRGMVMVLGDVAPDDHATATPQQLAAKVLASAHGGSIIVLHDGAAGDPSADRTVVVRALPLILDGLQQRGLRAVRLDELLAVQPTLPRCAFTDAPQTS
jgi:UDP-glucose 4-epimerase